MRRHTEGYMPREEWAVESRRSLGSAPIFYPPVVLSRSRNPGEETNDFIDAMCSLSDHEAQSLEWLLDLEFGPPHSRPPSHRHIAYFDPVKRVIMSASQANTVHPDFLRCNERFRDILVERYLRREVLNPTQQAPAENYHELYIRLEEQRKMQDALTAASAARNKAWRC